MQNELVALGRTPQRVLELEQAHRALVHRLVEDLEPRLARGLRLVHRGVGIAQQVLRAFVLRAAVDNADRQGGENVLTADPDWRLEGVEDPLHHVSRVVPIVEVVEQDREFVSSEARHRVLGAQGRLQDLADLHQELIARNVSQGVVHHLEPIEIEEQSGELEGGAALEARHRGAQAVHEQRAVRQAGEGVMERVVKEAFLRPPPLGDVRADRGHAADSARRIAQDGRVPRDHPRFAARGEDLVFLVGHRSRLHALRERLLHLASPIEGDHEVEPVAADHTLLVQSEEFEGVLIRERDVPASIQQDGDELDVLDQFAEPSLRLAHRALRELAVGDVEAHGQQRGASLVFDGAQGQVDPGLRTLRSIEFEFESLRRENRRRRGSHHPLA